MISGSCHITWHALCEEALTITADFGNNQTLTQERRNQQMSVIKRFALLLATLWLTAQTAFAAGGSADLIVLVADSRKLTGIMAWWANLYNDSHAYFTILTIILIPLIGVIFGLLADLIMHFVGIDLKSRDLAEH
jgi:hypothetical protein